MDDAQTQVGDEIAAFGDSPTEYRLPPLRLYHFFALIAIAALLLTVLRPGLVSSADDEFLGRWWIVVTIGATLYAFLMAIATTVTLFGLAWRLKGIPFPLQPGHWLLVAMAATHALGMLIGALLPEDVTSLMWLNLIFRIPDVIVYVYIGRKHRTQQRWKSVFYSAAFASVVPVLGHLALLLRLSWADVSDRRERVKRDILHFAGVYLQIASSLMIICLFGLILIVAFSQF